MQSLNFHCHWRPVYLGENGAGYSYPAKFTVYLREHYSQPAVYRWRVHPGENGKPEPVYIGQAEDLVTRIQRVLTPAKAGKGGETNKRLKILFDKEVAKGKVVFLDVADIEIFELNGVLFSNKELSDPFRRIAIENLLLCEAQAKGHVILNKTVEPADKAMAKLKKLKPAELRRLLKEFESKKEGLRKGPEGTLPE